MARRLAPHRALGAQLLEASEAALGVIGAECLGVLDTISRGHDHVHEDVFEGAAAHSSQNLALSRFS
jgi:hypothetical protein